MQYVYIHGFGTTGKESKKFEMISDFCTINHHQAFALEWHPSQQNILEDLELQLNEVIDYSEPICFIGSSTGGNFCIQLINKLANLSSYTSILINPFTDLDQRKIEDDRFPKSLADQMDRSTAHFNKSIILLGDKDEVLDAHCTYLLFKDIHEIVWIENGNHSLNDYLLHHFKEHLQKVIV